MVIKGKSGTYAVAAESFLGYPLSVAAVGVAERGGLPLVVLHLRVTTGPNHLRSVTRYLEKAAPGVPVARSRSNVRAALAVALSEDAVPDAPGPVRFGSVVVPALETFLEQVAADNVAVRPDLAKTLDDLFAESLGKCPGAEAYRRARSIKTEPGVIYLPNGREAVTPEPEAAGDFLADVLAKKPDPDPFLGDEDDQLDDED